MKCVNCNEEWELHNLKNLKEKYCPFCGKEIICIDKDSVVDVTSFFRYALYHEGKVFFKNSQKVLGLFSDFLPDLIVEKRILKMVLESEIYEKINVQSKEITNDEISKYITYLENDFGLSTKWAKAAIEWYIRALNIEVNSNLVHTNDKSIINDSREKKRIKEKTISENNQYEKFVRIAFDFSMIPYSEIRKSSESGNWVLTTDDTLIVGKKGRSHATDKSQWSRVKVIILSPGIQFTETRGFYGLNNLEKVYLPSSLKTIGFQSFGECEHLNTVSIESGELESINGRAFENCKNLKRINIPNSVRFIGDRAFVDCTSLKTTVSSQCAVYTGNSAIEKKG